MKRSIAFLFLLAVATGLGWAWYTTQQPPTGPLAEVEIKLAPLGSKLGTPQPGEWLHRHQEPGQTFQQYVNVRPVRRDERRKAIYLCLLGDFSPEQLRVLELTKEYMAIYFDVPVKVHKRKSLKEIPDHVRRKHPQWGDPQILTLYVLDEVLKPECPEDALAYLAFTSSDLWPGAGWNFVFGQATLKDRVGVWSIYRYGDPATDEAAFRRCLIRTMKVATHETGHILTMHHCIAYECNMNGSNSLPESDRQPLHLCPVCLRKICWNLGVEPVPYLTRLRDFCQKHGLQEEAQWYGKALAALRK